MGATGPFGDVTEPASARQEAERLVATVLAMAGTAASGVRDRAGGSLGPLTALVSGVFDQLGGHGAPGTAGPDRGAGHAAATGPGSDRGAGSAASGAGPANPSDPAGSDASSGGGFATGTAECCVCPLCRAIAALRDPDPEFVERLATGAGDLAAGVASLLRAFSTAPSGAHRTAPAGTRTEDPVDGPRAGADEPPAGRPESDDAEVWREATRTGHDSWPADEPDVWARATRAEPDIRPARAEDGPDRSTSTGVGGVGPATPPTAGRPSVPTTRAPEDPVGAGHRADDPEPSDDLA